MSDLKNTWVNRTFRGRRLEDEKNIRESREDIRQSIKDIPRYQIPEEAMQYMQYMQESAEDLEGVKDIAREATDIAKARTGATEAPGAAISKRDIQQSTAGTVQNILQAGGGASAMGAITQVGLAEQSALRDVAMSTQQYRSQAESDLMKVLSTEAGIVSNVEQAQAGLMGQGFGTMIGEKGKQYESDLSKYLTGVQFESQVLGGMQYELENMKNRRAQLLATGIQATAQVASSLISGVKSGLSSGLSSGL